MTKLQKCKDKMLFGVCCGIAKSLGLDVSVVRVGFVIGTLFTGSLLFWMYLLFAIVLPKQE